MEKIVIQPKSSLELIDLGEIIRFRELLYIFAWRDIKVRYKQTVLGVLWVVLQPLIMTFIFTIFFGRMAQISSGELPYSLFVLSGLVFWTFFSGSLTHASNCMVENENIVKKVYFPKVILPLSSVLTGLVDLIINLFLLFIFAAVIGYLPRLSAVVIFPFAISVATVTAFGLGLFLSAVNVKYRDVRYILPFFIQLLLFVTPVIYPLTNVSEQNRYIMAVNPMSLVVELVRFSLSANYQIYPSLIVVSVFSSIAFLILGLWYFDRTQRFFADII